MSLPTCECVKGLPIPEQLSAIYCALYEIAVNGAAVSLDSISGISDFWKSALAETPAADQVFGTDGAGAFTTFPISDAGVNLLQLVTPASESLISVSAIGAVSSYDAAGSAEFIALGDPGVTGGPFTTVTTVNGIVTVAS